MLQMEHSAILSTFIKLPFVIKIFALLIFEWPLKTSFTVDKAYLFVTSQSTIFSKTNQDVSRIKPGPEVIKCL